MKGLRTVGEMPWYAMKEARAYQISEIAANFKDQGNDYFKGKRYREAVGFYTQGLDVKPGDVKLTTALLCNRAACNLELREYDVIQQAWVMLS